MKRLPKRQEVRTTQIFHQESLVKGFGFLQAIALGMEFKENSPRSHEPGRAHRYVVIMWLAFSLFLFLFSEIPEKTKDRT